MITGKISENVTKRSVLRLMKKHREEINSAVLGSDCAFFASENVTDMVSSTAIITYTDRCMGEVAVYRMADTLAAAGAEPVGIMADVLLAPDNKEDELKKIVNGLEETCAKLNMQIMQVQAEVTEAVVRPVLTVTGFGYRRPEFKHCNPLLVKPGQDIVITKYIGLEGTYLLAAEYADKIAGKLPLHFVDTALSFKDDLSVIKEAVAVANHASYMHAVTEGGIFAALWNLGELSKKGLTVDLKKIPIRQETVEICEIFKLNPYQMMSAGALLIVTEDGEGLVDGLMSQGISATVIGRITDTNDRIVINEDETRYLDLPKPDEIFSVNKSL